MNKGFAATAIVIAAVLGTGGTAVAASTLKTVSQKAAEAAPPPPSVVTAAVGKRQLFDTVDLTCKAGYRSEVSVSGSGKSPLVLTATPLKSGDSVGDGTLLAEINGSPVFAVTGAFPLYRDLKLKDSGPDARMVNDALVRAGRLLKQPEPSASTVTSYTAAAVAALYTQAGYTAPATGDPVVSASAFQVLPDVGTVSGNVHSTGLLEAEPIATIGVGPRGMICSAANGTVPAEAKSGQQARIAAFGPELRPVTIIAKPVQNPGLAADSGKPAIPSQDLTPSGGAETSALFVEVEEATSKTDKVLPASLILSQSAPEPLVVPSSALWTREGQSLVTVQDDSGFRDVPVVVNFSAGGENAVSAASQESSLTEGDKVVVAGAR